ncbi:MAG TPA: hypothetical protein VIC62_18075 [Nakamurella sp.]|jgi:hypothetical protein
MGATACSSEPDPEVQPSGTVRAVPSGDSVTLLVDGNETTVDLAFVEAPDQNSAQEAESCLAR